jgi:hypothetical protein
VGASATATGNECGRLRAAVSAVPYRPGRGLRLSFAIMAMVRDTSMIGVIWLAMVGLNERANHQIFTRGSHDSHE